MTGSVKISQMPENRSDSYLNQMPSHIYLLLITLFLLYLSHKTVLVIFTTISIVAPTIYFSYRLKFPNTKCDTGEQRRALFENNPDLHLFPITKNITILPDIKKATRKVALKRKFIKNENGALFHSQKWETDTPNHKPKRVIFFIHGYSSGALFHFDLLCRCLSSQGFTVFALDGYGHGLSDGLHGFIPDFDAYVKDYMDYFLSVMETYPEGTPYFLFGVSMGAAVAIRILGKDAERKLFKGALLSSPMVQINEETIPHPFVYKVFEWMSHLFPTAKLTPTGFREKFYNIEEIEEEIKKYELTYHCRSRLKTSHELVKLCEIAQMDAHKVTHPLLVMHGELDRVTSPKGSRKFFDKVSSKDKTINIYEGQRHGLFFDDLSASIFEEAISWFQSRV